MVVLLLRMAISGLRELEARTIPALVLTEAHHPGGLEKSRLLVALLPPTNASLRNEVHSKVSEHSGSFALQRSPTRTC